MLQGFAAFHLTLSRIPPRHSQTTRATNCANPGFLVIQFCTRCGQTCGQAFFLTTSTCGGSAFIVGVSRDCGHGIFRLEGGATRSQTRRDTNFAIPGYSISAIIPRRGRKSKIFLSVVIPVVKTTFMPFSATGGKPAIARAARLCGLLSKPRMDRVYALPKQARYQLRNTPIFNKTPLYYSIMGRFRKAFLVMVKIVGWLQKRVNFRKTETRKPLCRKALRRFQKMGLTKSYYVPKQARYQLRYTRILLILE